MTPLEFVGQGSLLLAALLGSSLLIGWLPQGRSTASRVATASFWLALAFPFVMMIDILRAIACPRSEPDWTSLPLSGAVGLVSAALSVLLLRARRRNPESPGLVALLDDRQIVLGVGTLLAVWAAADFSVIGYRGVVFPIAVAVVAITVNRRVSNYEESYADAFRRIALAQLAALPVIVTAALIVDKVRDRAGVPMGDGYWFLSWTGILTSVLFWRLMPRVSRAPLDIPLLLVLGLPWLFAVRHGVLSGAMVTLGPKTMKPLWDLLGPLDPRMFYWEAAWAMTFGVVGAGLFAAHVASRLGRTAGLVTFELSAGLAILGWSYRFTSFLILLWLVIAEAAAVEVAAKASRRVRLAIAFVVATLLPIDVTLQMGTGPSRFVATGIVHYRAVDDAPREGWVIVGSVPTFYSNPFWAWIW